MKILNLFKKKRMLTREEILQEQFNIWKTETLQLNKDSFSIAIPDRLYIKNGDWFFNDYFDQKYSPDVVRISQRFMREATEEEKVIYNKFKTLIDSLKSDKDKKIERTIITEEEVREYCLDFF